MADDVMGVGLMLGLPGVRADSAATEALALLDAAMADGDTCIDLAELLRERTLSAPDIEHWKTSLLESGLCTEGDGGRPLILDGDLLSSRRYWHYERFLAHTLRERAADLSHLHDYQDDPQIIDDVRALFPPKRAARVEGVDWQRLACVVALAHNLSVITGGPGTGKTTVAGNTIAIAARIAARAQRELRVVIAAPTGKAAQRLRESLIATGRSLVRKQFLSEEQLEALTRHVSTLHRLLRDRQLAAADLVVIDEVSMADAATLARALARVPRSAQIMLLGDPQQLASVDAGHVLGEIAKLDHAQVAPGVQSWYLRCLTTKEPVAYGDNVHPLSLAQVRLRKNWRSAASPAITELAAAMQESALQAQCTLADPALGPQAGSSAEGHPTWIERRDCSSPHTVAATIFHDMRYWLLGVLGAKTAADALEAHAHQRILCARRSGPLGAEWFNDHIETALDREGLILPWEDGHYHGRPILMTRNDYDLQLYNGDIGVVWGQRNQAQAWFATGTGDLRAVPLHRLHSVEPVFAMTIHKSQGSQFDHTEIVTAMEDAGPIGDLLTRELLYTAVTRSAYSARIWADEDLLVRSIDRRKIRRTGLGRFLRRDD